MTTKKITLTLLLVTAFAILGQTNAEALPLCTGSLAALEAGGPCMDVLGNFTLNFVATSGSNMALNDANITVGVSSSGPTNLQVTYQPSTSFGINGGIGMYNFEYTVIAANGYLLTNMAISLLNPQIGANGDVVSGFKKVTQTGDQTTTPALSNMTNNGTTLANNVNLPFLAGPLTIEDNLTLVQFAGGTATTGNIVNDLNFAVPEPLTAFLSGFGLLGVGLFRKILKR
jgi:hypothetical protein